MSTKLHLKPRSVCRLSPHPQVLRGPSALAYGGGASGGVVNVLDQRVPTAVPEKGVEGSIELRADSCRPQRAAARPDTSR